MLQPGLPAVSVQWGPWAEVGMAARAGTTESGGYLRLDPTASLQAEKGGPSTATVCWADLAKSSRYLGRMLQDGLNENCSDLLQTSQFLMVKSCFSSSSWSQHPPSFGVDHKS